MTTESSADARANIFTVVAVAVVAYAACDLIHELLGHGTACFFIRSVKPISVSTVALQTKGVSRIVAASGSVANILVGVTVLALLRLTHRFTPAAYFAWLLAATNLMNGTGYLLFSGLTTVGDWSVVIRNWSPHWLWRLALVVLGAFGYSATVIAAARSLTRFVQDGSLAYQDLRRVANAAYFAGGLLLLIASALNRISPILILTSGASTGFGAMAGLLAIPPFVKKQTHGARSQGVALPFSRSWVLSAIVVAAFFIGILGPGVPLT
jgi:hypothetical protein